ncbi:hypothetical protein [Bradyrhizobium embrapense]
MRTVLLNQQQSDAAERDKADRSPPGHYKAPAGVRLLQRWSQPTVSAGLFRTIQLEHKTSYLREFNMAPGLMRFSIETDPMAPDPHGRLPVLQFGALSGCGA